MKCQCTEADSAVSVGYSPFVHSTIDTVVGWLFEDVYAKESARYFQAALNSFRIMLKKVPDGWMLNIRTNRQYSLSGGMPTEGS